MDESEEAFRERPRPHWLAGRRSRTLIVVVAVAVAAIALVIGTVSGRTSGPAPAATPSSTPDAAGWVRVAPSPLAPRWGAAGVWVMGRYLVVGGFDGVPCPPNASCVERWNRLTDGALYDPETNTWTPIAPVPSARGVAIEAVVLGSSVYLLEEWGGRGKPPRSLLRYDLATDAWRTYRVPQPAGDALVATDRSVVVLSGSDEGGVVPDRVLTPEDSAWSTLPKDPLGPSFNRGALWLGDRLLLTGHRLVASPGAKEPSLMRLAVLDRTLTRWRRLPDSPILGSGGARYVSGRVVWPSIDSADGGEVGNWGRFYPFGAIYDPASGAWTELPAIRGRGGLSGNPVATERLVAVAGDLLDPVSLAWTAVPASPASRRTGATVVGGPDSVLCWGGSNGRLSYAEGFLLRV